MVFACVAFTWLLFHQWHMALSAHRENPFVQQSEREQMEANQHAMRWASRDTAKLLRSETLATLKQEDHHALQQNHIYRSEAEHPEAHSHEEDPHQNEEVEAGVAGNVRVEESIEDDRNFADHTQERGHGHEEVETTEREEEHLSSMKTSTSSRLRPLPILDLSPPGHRNQAQSQARMAGPGPSKDLVEAKVEDRKKKEELMGRGSGGSKKTMMYMDMYKDGFTGAFIMNRAKYRGEKMGEPVRVAKYMFQCLEPNPPRGCDLEAAKRDPPRGRGWQRVARISKEFLQALPEADEVRSRARWQSCAVVGNGGSLLLSAGGAAIDAHEAVIRFNGGITKGFEQYVGTKTTVRLTNTQHMGFHEREEELVLQHITMERAMDKLLEVKQKHPKLAIFATDGDFHQYVLDTMGDGAASNGFFGMVFAYERCDQVTIYGFHKSWRTGDAGLVKTKYHYYDKVEPNESQTRRDDVETPRLMAFLRQHLDVFKYADPQLDTQLREGSAR